MYEKLKHNFVLSYLLTTCYKLNFSKTGIKSANFDALYKYIDDIWLQYSWYTYVVFGFCQIKKDVMNSEIEVLS